MLPVAILCGGKATRLGTRAASQPKALVLVAGRPFIDRQLAWLAECGVTDVVLCVGYLGDAIERHVGDGSGWGIRAAYSADGSSPLGTGGALRRALPLLGEAFVAIYGDSLPQCSPQDAARTLREGRDAGVMTVFRNRDRWMPSNVRVEGDRVIAYDKQAPPGSMTYIDYGLNAFRSSIFREFPENSPFDLAQVHRALIRRGGLRAIECGERCYEIGSPEGLEETEQFIRSKSSNP